MKIFEDYNPSNVRKLLDVSDPRLLSPMVPSPIILDDSIVDVLTQENIFHFDECSQIIEEYSPEEGVDASMYLESTPETLWMFDKLLACALKANEFYQFDIDYFDSVLLEKYDEIALTGGWHMDIDAGRHGNRKLSMVVQLTSPDFYTGGELDIAVGKDWVAPTSVGSVIVFPSFLSHRVRPVSKGTRYSLAVCCAGNRRFR